MCVRVAVPVVRVLSRFCKRLTDLMRTCLLRFHEGRDDFNAADVKSRLRVVVTDGWKVTVGVDAAGSGSWVSCVSETPLAGLPEAWAALPEGSSMCVCARISRRPAGMLAGAPRGFARVTHAPRRRTAARYVGVTATTGQLADNHDVLSLVVRRRRHARVRHWC